MNLSKSAFILIGVAIALVSMLGFMLAVQSAAAPYRYVFVVLYLAATVVLFLVAAVRMPLHALIGSGLVIAVTAVILGELLAFRRFAVLVRGVELFDWYAVQPLAMALLGAMTWYFALAELTHWRMYRGGDGAEFAGQSSGEKPDVWRAAWFVGLTFAGTVVYYACLSFARFSWAAAHSSAFFYTVFFIGPVLLIVVAGVATGVWRNHHSIVRYTRLAFLAVTFPPLALYALVMSRFMISGL